MPFAHRSTLEKGGMLIGEDDAILVGFVVVNWSYIFRGRSNTKTDDDVLPLSILSFVQMTQTGNAGEGREIAKATEFACLLIWGKFSSTSGDFGVIIVGGGSRIEGGLGIGVGACGASEGGS